MGRPMNVCDLAIFIDALRSAEEKKIDPLVQINGKSPFFIFSYDLKKR
jgi:hypothetical protein